MAPHPVKLTQAEFCRLARGDQIVPGQGPPAQGLFLLGMRSSAGAACRDVHRATVAHARSRLNDAVKQSLFEGGSQAAFARTLLRCLERYIALNATGTGASAADLGTKSMPIAFSTGDIVKARPDVVLGPNAEGAHEARVLLFDDLPLDRVSAEMIALPAVEFVSAKLGGTTSSVEVWQLSLGQQETVSSPQAQARRQDVENLLATV